MADDGRMSKRRRPVMVIKSIEGRRATAEHPIAREDYERQLEKLRRNGLRLPKATTQTRSGSV